VFDRAPRFFKPECGKGGRPIPRPILTPTKPRRQLKKTLMFNNKNKLPWLGTMDKIDTVESVSEMEKFLIERPCSPPLSKFNSFDNNDDNGRETTTTRKQKKM